MAHDPRKTRTVAVKVEEDLAGFLARLPNKSEFIRQAILAQFGTACPLCTGTGQVASAIAHHYLPVLARYRETDCLKCGMIESIPGDLSSVEEQELPRWEQFFHGGPFFCGKCFVMAQACGECGWHFSPDLLEHHDHTKPAEIDPSPDDDDQEISTPRSNGRGRSGEKCVDQRR